MANPSKGEVGFDANGISYTLVLDFNAICELEDAFDVPASQIGEVIGEKLSSLRTVFRVALSRHHDVTDLEAGEILTSIGAEKAGSLIASAFALSFPEAKAKAGQAPGKLARR